MCSVTFFSLWESYLYWCASPKEKFSHFKISSFFWRPSCIFLFICFFLNCFTVNKDFHGICVCDVHCHIIKISCIFPEVLACNHNAFWGVRVGLGQMPVNQRD